MAKPQVLESKIGSFHPIVKQVNGKMSKKYNPNGKYRTKLNAW